AYAKELLAESSLPVAEVAYRAGFTDVNNFIRTFKRDAGRTPLRYREEQTQV
ncbi:MAG: helix-turn-helix domain-containing protein, partial [Butyricicoccus sp.]|nr:helix-turn-helix domain-containing protein [Butyricicoccus sp.]